jgi:ATP synthase protein I
MSSRMENDDPWLGHGLRTASCGPRRMLPAARVGRYSMTAGTRSGVGDQDQEPQSPEPRSPEPRAPRESDGWQILSYMLGGMILYGGIGWLIGHVTGISILFPIGMLLGVGMSVALVIFKFTRSGPGRE